DSEMVQLVRANAQAVSGIDPAPIISLGGTDARLWRYKELPAIVYGPSPTGMGSFDEHVTVDESSTSSNATFCRPTTTWRARADIQPQRRLARSSLAPLDFAGSRRAARTSDGSSTCGKLERGGVSMTCRVAPMRRQGGVCGGRRRRG